VDQKEYVVDWYISIWITDTCLFLLTGGLELVLPLQETQKPIMPSDSFNKYLLSMLIAEHSV